MIGSVDLAAAALGMRALLSDPDDTSQVFRVIEALSGNTSQRLVRRLRRAASGRRLLRERPALLTQLSDRRKLAAMPAKSFGRAYLAFCREAGIEPEGLIQASVAGSSGNDALDDEARYVAERTRDAHDLWHVATGYHSDLIGEAALLAFTYAQTHNRGVGFIALMALFKTRAHPELRRVIVDGYKRGRDAAWLVDQPWEALLPEPLAEVRKRLQLPDPPAYERIYAGDLL